MFLKIVMYCFTGFLNLSNNSVLADQCHTMLRGPRQHGPRGLSSLNFEITKNTPIARPCGRTKGCLLWALVENGHVITRLYFIASRSLSGRTAGAVWWFFALLVITSYLSTLIRSAVLGDGQTLSPFPIGSAYDLAQQTEVKYGTVFGGSTMEFFKVSYSVKSRWVIFADNCQMP